MSDSSGMGAYNKYWIPFKNNDRIMKTLPDLPEIGETIYVNGNRRKIVYVSDHVLEWNYGWCRIEQVSKDNNKWILQ